MADSPNKQPIFTSSPVLICTTFDADINDNSTNPDSWLTGGTILFDQRTLIERVSISACGDVTTNPIVSAKLVYVFLYSGNSGTYSLYKTLAMPATTLDATTPNPELEITMNGGVLFNADDGIVCGVSVNAADSGEPGDYLAITVEGGTFEAV